CQTSHLRPGSRHCESFPVLGKGRFMACRLDRKVAGGLKFAVEDDFQQATPERIHKQAPIIRIGEQHGANAEVWQKEKVTLEACDAAAVTDNRNSVFAVYYQAHPISLVLAVGNLRRTARPQI